jgi:hypothetical protein
VRLGLIGLEDFVFDLLCVKLGCFDPVIHAGHFLLGIGKAFLFG